MYRCHSKYLKLSKDGKYDNSMYSTMMIKLYDYTRVLDIVIIVIENGPMLMKSLKKPFSNFINIKR